MICPCLISVIWVFDPDRYAIGQQYNKFYKKKKKKKTENRHYAAGSKLLYYSWSPDLSSDKHVLLRFTLGFLTAWPMITALVKNFDGSRVSSRHLITVGICCNTSTRRSEFTYLFRLSLILLFYFYLTFLFCFVSDILNLNKAFIFRSIYFYSYYYTVLPSRFSPKYFCRTLYFTPQ
jgi:hypothetical protein